MTMLEAMKKEMEELKQEIEEKKRLFYADLEKDKQGTLQEVFCFRKKSEYGINEVSFMNGDSSCGIFTISFRILFEDDSTEFIWIENPIFK